MKWLAYSLLVITCALQAHNRFLPDGTTTRHMSTYAAITRCPKLPTCTGIRKCRGPRGYKGNRGPRGPRGRRGPAATSCGLNYLFINAPMMTDYSGANPDITFYNVYGPATTTTTPTVTAWMMYGSFLDPRPIVMQFVFPNDMDTTQPVTLTLHCLNNFNVEAIGFVSFQVQADYKSNGEEIGVLSPATGFAETLVTPNHLIVDPNIDDDEANLSYFTTSVPLNGSLIAGNTWGNLAIKRIQPGEEFDYSARVYLTAVSIEYTRLCEPLS